MKRYLGLLLSIAMVLSVVYIYSFPMSENDLSVVNAAGDYCYSSLNTYNLYSYNVQDYQTHAVETTANKGYYIVPDKPGKYPVLFLLHGSGGAGDYKRDAVKMFNQWVALGYMEPMVVIMPEIDQKADKDWGVEDFRIYIQGSNKKHFGELLSRVKSGSMAFSDKVDTNKPMSVAGFSMGAAASFYLGAKYSTDLVNMGILSPASAGYLGDGQYGWLNHETEIKFSQRSDAHFLMAYGQGANESSFFKSNAERYMKGFENNRQNDPDNNANDFAFYTRYKGDHEWATFEREIFVFMYYVNKGNIPSDSIIEQACGPYIYGQAPSPSSGSNSSSTGAGAGAGSSSTGAGDSSSSQLKNGSWNKVGDTWYYVDSSGKKVANQWVDGLWLGSDGAQKYKPKASWKHNAKGWWYEDTSGWYAKSQWQKIDGKWYYFGSDGYLAMNEWVDGYWLGSSGAWTYASRGSWKLGLKGWWFGDTSGWYAKNQWQKIDGKWYYFDFTGYMATNKRIDGYWVGSDGAYQ